MVAREKVSYQSRDGRRMPVPPVSPAASSQQDSPRKQSKKKQTVYKPSRVTVEYYANNKDSSGTTSPRSERRNDAATTPSRRPRPLPLSPSSMQRTPATSSPRVPPPPKSPATPSRHRSVLLPTSPGGASVSSQRSTKSLRSNFSFSLKKKKKEPLLPKEIQSKTPISTPKSPRVVERSPPTYIPPVVETTRTIMPTARAATGKTIQSNEQQTQVRHKERQELFETAVLSNAKSMDSVVNDKYETNESPPPHNRQRDPESQRDDEIGAVLSSNTQGSGIFTGTFTEGTYADDTYADDTFADETFSVESEYMQKRNYLRYRFSNTLSDGSSFADVSVAIRQQVAWGCILLTAIQFAILTTQVLLCGCARLGINPTIGPYPDAFSEWGGKNAYLLVEQHQYFRLITPSFLHVGYLHFLVNAFFQLETVAYYEREWGFFRWIFLYLVSGFGASLAAAAVDPDIIGVCSSGALMGLFGARIAQAIVWAAFDSRDKYVGQGALILERLGGTVCSSAVVFCLTFLTYIDWSGHLGGFCTGFLCGLVTFAYAVRSTGVRTVLRLLGLAGLVIGGIVLGVILFYYGETDEDMADACEYFRNLYSEGYMCECEAFY